MLISNFLPMRLIIINICLIVNFFFASAEPIIYSLPDRVTSKMQNWVESFDQDSLEQVFFHLGHTDNTQQSLYQFYLQFCEGVGYGQWGKMAERTNRFVLVGHRLFPLILDYDDFLGVSFNQDISEICLNDSEEEAIKRSTTIFHGKTIYFNLKQHSNNTRLRLQPVLTTIAPRDSNVIAYVIPNTIPISNIKSVKDTSAVVFIRREGDKKIQVTVTSDGVHAFLRDETHRFAIIEKQKVPVLLDYDLLFFINAPTIISETERVDIRT